MELCPSPLTGAREQEEFPRFNYPSQFYCEFDARESPAAKREMRRPFANNVDQRQLRVRLQFVRFDIAAVPCSAFDNVTVIILWLNFTTQETERQRGWGGTDRDVGLRNSCSISFTRVGFSTVAVRKFLGDGTRRRVAIRIPSVSRCNWVNAS